MPRLLLERIAQPRPDFGTGKPAPQDFPQGRRITPARSFGERGCAQRFKGWDIPGRLG
jgi:hypothetical protein